MIEIDTPGHTAIISEAYPEHIACALASPWSTFASGTCQTTSCCRISERIFFYKEPPAGQLRIASNATAAFTAELLAAVAKMFPSTLMSTGGDEVNTQCYVDDSETQAELAQSGFSFEEALSAFTVTTHSAIQSLGKTPVVWEGMYDLR